MFAPPRDFDDASLRTALLAGWGLKTASLTYRPVGFGSHHWDAVDADGTAWFVTVDDLPARRFSADEPLDEVLDRLRAALSAAGGLADAGHDFVVAPIQSVEGGLVRGLGECFGVSVYPFVVGESFSWSPTTDDRHREAVLPMLVALHTSARKSWAIARPDDFGVQLRDGLEAALAAGRSTAEHGPYSVAAADLVATHAEAIRRMLLRYDELVDVARAQTGRFVLTHGEPHPGNTMLTADGWRLIDWDTALVAPPERDLWDLDPGDGSLLAAYAEATGVAPDPAMLELYRHRWDLSEAAIYASLFRAPHTGDANDRQSWEGLARTVAQISSWDAQ